LESIKRAEPSEITHFDPELVSDREMGLIGSIKNS